jgi:hypothetical protein
MEKLLKLPRTRKAAKELGELYYFTGEPCIHGHVDKRRTYNWDCYSCTTKRTKGSNSAFKRKKHQKTKSRLIHSNQMPAWADKSVIGDMLLLARSRGMVLDHIVPLKGRTNTGVRVCGLHCEDNLQEMSYEDNGKKSFSVWPNMPEEGPYKKATYSKTPESVKLRNKVSKWHGNCFGVSYDKRKKVYKVRFRKKFVGSAKDLFSAYCIRKSQEAKFISENSHVLDL